MLKQMILGAVAIGLVAVVTPPAQAATADGVLTCREAAKLKYPADRKMRHEFRKACKQAWRSQQNAAPA